MERFQIGDYWLAKRPDSKYWYRIWFDRAAKQTRGQSLGTKDLREAQIRLAEWVVANQAPKQAPDLLLGQVSLRYYENHAKHLPSGNSIKHALRHWSGFFDGAMVSEITKAAQEGFIRNLRAKGLSDGYIQRIFTIGRAAVNYAKDNGELVNAPKILYVPAQSKEARVLTQEEVKALFAAIESEHGYMYFMLAFNTWARMEAILDLTVFQVKLDERLINLNPPGRTQNKKHRPMVPITNTLLPALQNPTGEHLVNWYGRPIKHVRKLIRDTAARAKIGPINSRTIRHTMATWARSEGVPMWEIEGMLGHRLPSTSESYAKWIPRHDSPAAIATDEFLIGTLLVRNTLRGPHSNWRELE